MSRGARLALPLLAVLALTGCGGGPADRGTTVTVLAAASLTEVMEQIAADVEADHPGVSVETSFAASSTIVQQVNEGAPADVVVLAGEQSLAPLDQQHRVGTPQILTTNTLELAVPPDDPAGIDGLADLTGEGLRLVVCAPEVPCGSAAATLLGRLADPPEVVSYEPDVRAVLSKVALGEADVGIVYRTDVAGADGTVRGVAVPAADNVVNRYPILAVSDAPLAQAFVDEAMSPRGQQHLADAGFVAP